MSSGFGIRCVWVSLILVGCGGHEGIREREFLGEWEALSRNHVALLGSMEVGGRKIVFEAVGEVAFEVIGFDGDEYLLRLGSEVESTRIMRLGPIRRGDGISSGRDIEVAFYATEEDARTPRKRRSTGASSWGIYVRE